MHRVRIIALWISVSSLVSLAIALITAARLYLMLTEFAPDVTYREVFWRMFETYAPWSVLAPACGWMAAYTPIQRRGLWVRLLAHASMLVLVTIAFDLLREGIKDLLATEQMLRLPIEPALLSSGVYIVIVAGVHVYDSRRRLQEREVMLARAEGTLARARLEAIKARLEPHFLFNTLQSVTTLLHRSPDDAERMIVRLSELLRRSLDQNWDRHVALDKEIAFIEIYLEIESVRLGDRLRVQWDVEDDTRRALVPVMILQPFVENAIRHGVAKRVNGGEIMIRSWKQNDRLVLSCVDNGPGFCSTTYGDSADGVGIRLSQDRLHCEYPDNHRITIEGGPEGGATIIINIPYCVADTDGQASQ
jgi:signal transduction histidine kinase